MYSVLQTLLPGEASADLVIGLHIVYLFATAAMLFTIGWKIRGNPLIADRLRSPCTWLVPIAMASIAIAAAHFFRLPGLYRYDGVNYWAVLNDFLWLTTFCRAGRFFANPAVQKWLSKDREMGYIRSTDSWHYPWEKPEGGFDDVRYGPPTGWEHLYEGLHAVGKLLQGFAGGAFASFQAGRRSEVATTSGGSTLDSLKSMWSRVLRRPVEAA